MDITRVYSPQKRFIIGNKAIHVSLKARDKDWGGFKRDLGKTILDKSYLRLCGRVDECL